MSLHNDGASTVAARFISLSSHSPNHSRFAGVSVHCCRRNVRSAISFCVRDSGSIIYCTDSELIGAFAPGLSTLVGFSGGLGVEYIGIGEDIVCLKLMLSYH